MAISQVFHFREVLDPLLQQFELLEGSPQHFVVSVLQRFSSDDFLELGELFPQDISDFQEKLILLDQTQQPHLHLLAPHLIQLVRLSFPLKQVPTPRTLLRLLPLLGPHSLARLHLLFSLLRHHWAQGQFLDRGHHGQFQATCKVFRGVADSEAIGAFEEAEKGYHIFFGELEVEVEQAGRQSLERSWADGLVGALEGVNEEPLDCLNGPFDHLSCYLNLSA